MTSPIATKHPRTTAPPNDERLRRYWDSHAAGYDREMAFLERILFEDGRQWACSQATGDVLTVAIGTGRNLPFYAPDVRLTAIEFSPGMLETPAGARRSWTVRWIYVLAMPRRWICRMRHSTR